jgi:ElaB/YqjD/DUF883 family membrane-anchored ribosome-binding protein
MASWSVALRVVRSPSSMRGTIGRRGAAGERSNAIDADRGSGSPRPFFEFIVESDDRRGTSANGERLGVVATLASRPRAPGETRMTVETNSIDDKAAETAAKMKKAAKAAVSDAADAAQSRLNEAIDLADRNIRDAARRVELALRDGFDQLRDRAEPYRDSASQQIDEAQKYVVGRIKERPVVATLAGLGIGLLLGLLMANRSDR